MKTKLFSIATAVWLACTSFSAMAIETTAKMGFDLAQTAHQMVTKGMILAGYMLFDVDPLAPVMKALDGIEAKMKEMSDKSAEEIKNVGKVASDTQTAIDNLGIKQRELADELLQIKQKQTAPANEEKKDDSWGYQFVKSDGYLSFQKGERKDASFEVKNTVTNAIGNTFSDRKPGIVTGAFREFTLERLLTTLPTSSGNVEYVRENVFTNNAAEVAEGAQKPESSITTTLVNEPVATVAHWIKISKQLAADNAALAAYINTRMIYGVNLRVENQIINGNGTAPNMSGFTKAGNFTAHGWTAATLNTALGRAGNRFDLIGKIIGDLKNNDYAADVVILNPADWWTMRLAQDTTGRYIMGDPGMDVPPSLFGLPVVSSNAMAVDTVLVTSLAQAATFYNRENVNIDMSPSDSDNFTKNLITILAERRCMLAVEKPVVVRYGDLTPA